MQFTFRVMEAKTLRLIGSCYNRMGKMGAAFKYMNSSWTKYTLLGEKIVQLLRQQSGIFPSDMDLKTDHLKLGQLHKERYAVKMSLVLFALKINNREAFCEHYGTIQSLKKMISNPPEENIWSCVFNRDQRDIRSNTCS